MMIFQPGPKWGTNQQTDIGTHRTATSGTENASSSLSIFSVEAISLTLDSGKVMIRKPLLPTGWGGHGW